jgi:hypothetical protein
MKVTGCKEGEFCGKNANKARRLLSICIMPAGAYSIITSGGQERGLRGGTLRRN